MWLGHSIKHLVCIGGELEHHKALPSPATKNRALGVLCSQGRYRQLIGPGSCHEPGPINCLHIPLTASRALSLLCFSWPARRELCGALAHLLCTRGVRWNARATLLKLSPLQARPPSSIFLNICLGLAVCHPRPRIHRRRSPAPISSPAPPW